MFHCIVQSSRQPREVAAIPIAIAQISKWVIERSGVSPRVLQRVEELGCEARLVHFEAVLSVIVLEDSASSQADRINLGSMDT